MVVNIFKNKELLITILAQACQFISSLLLLKLLTGEMTLSNYGELALLLSLSMLILALPFTAIQQGFYRYRSIYVSQYKEGIHLSAMIAGVSILLIFFFIISFIYVTNFESNEYINENYNIAVFFIFSEVYKIYLRTIVNADRNRTSYAFSIITEFSFKILGCFFFSASFEMKANDVLIIYSMANVISVLSLLYHGGLKFSLKISDLLEIRQLWKDVAIFSSPMLVWAFFGWLRDSGLRWFIEDLYSLNEVASFTALATVALVIPTILQSLLSVYIVPLLYSSKGADNEREIEEKFSIIMRFLYVVGLVVLAIFYCFHNEIVVFIIGEKYSADSSMLPIMFIGNFLFNCAMLKGNLLLANFKQMSLIWPNIISGISILIYGFFILPIFGLKSLPFGYSLPFIVYFFVTTIIVKKAEVR